MDDSFWKQLKSIFRIFLGMVLCLRLGSLFCFSDLWVRSSAGIILCLARWHWDFEKGKLIGWHAKCGWWAVFPGRCVSCGSLVYLGGQQSPGASGGSSDCGGGVYLLPVSWTSSEPPSLLSRPSCVQMTLASSSANL